MEGYSTDKTTEELWRMVLSQLQLDISAIAFKTWFAGSRMTDLSGGVAKIAFKSAYIKEYVENHYRNIVKRAMNKVLGDESVEPIFEVGVDETYRGGEYSDPIFSSNAQSEANIATETSNQLPQEVITYQQSTADSGASIENAVRSSGLNIRYTFENFVVGKGNQLAHAAALAISDNPGFVYNPLFIYGGVGLGKTHLMQAIGIEILRKKPSLKVLYTPAETFLNEMIQAIRFNKNLEFREKYRNIDVLIIDDIQVISGKEGTQEELFHTYNVLYQSNKQIIFAADRPPKEIQNLTDRLRSRMEGGMVADIKSPDYETRLVILERKAEEKNLYLPDHLIRVISELETDNVRELEGSLIKVGTHYYLNQNQLSEDEVRKILKKDIESKRKSVKPKDIIVEVAKIFNVSPSEIKGTRRTANVALARQVVMYLLRTELGLTLEESANEVKRKDHTTVLHAVEKVEEMTSGDEAFQEKVVEIKKALNRARAQSGTK